MATIYFAFWGTASQDFDEGVIGHTVNGLRIITHKKVPLGKWIWLHEGGRKHKNMTAAEARETAAEYEDRAGPPKAFRKKRRRR